MPKGPDGERRQADVIADAGRVMQIATGEAEGTLEGDDGKDRAAQAMGRKGGTPSLAHSSAEAWRRGEARSLKTGMLARLGSNGPLAV